MGQTSLQCLTHYSTLYNHYAKLLDTFLPQFQLTITIVMSQNVGMSNCCLSGKVHQGQPVVREDEIGDLSTNISEPKNHSKAKLIVFICDSGLPHLPFNPRCIVLSVSCPANAAILSLRVQIPQHPPPRRRICQSGLLRIRAGLSSRRLLAIVLSGQRRAPSQEARNTHPRRESQECRHRACHFRSMACETSRRCVPALDRRLC